MIDFAQRAGAADLDDLVDADAPRQLPDPPVPVGRRLVVDPVRGPQLLDPFELVVVARGGDDPGSGEPGELDGEDRDAAGPLGQHGVAGLDPPADDQRVPGRERRAGQGGGLLEAEMLGDADQAVLGKHDFLGEHAVDLAAQGGAGLGLVELAADPGGHEVGRDPIAGLEPGRPRAGRDHLAGPVRERESSAAASSGCRRPWRSSGRDN